jgi:hypothetical protein
MAINLRPDIEEVLEALLEQLDLGESPSPEYVIEFCKAVDAEVKRHGGTPYAMDRLVELGILKRVH